MIFGFRLTRAGTGTDFGIVAADSKEAAEAAVRNQVDENELLNLEVEDGCEAILDEQYGGIAFLTTE